MPQQITSIAFLCVLEIASYLGVWLSQTLPFRGWLGLGYFSNMYYAVCVVHGFVTLTVKHQSGKCLYN